MVSLWYWSDEGLAVWSSKDLVNWEFGGLAWKPTPGSWNNRYLYAPEVIEGDGGFYMYYTANLRIGVAFSLSPRGPFIDVYDHPFIGGGYGGVGDGIYLSGDVWEENLMNVLIDYEEIALDAHVHKALDGSMTIYFASRNPLSVISAMPMVDFVTLKPEEKKLVLREDLFSWENINREGPFVLERNGVFHLMYSGNYIDNNYAIGVATGPTPFGTFTRRSDNPILRKNASFNLAGPGHHSVVEGKYNDLLIFYHTRNWGDPPTAARKTRYMRMFFDRNGQIQIDKVKPGGK